MWFFPLMALLSSCRRAEPPTPMDHPRLIPGVALQDVIFHSTALNREMPYRVILPRSVSAGQKLPVVYLLHGGGGSFRDWSNYSDVAQFAAHLILVMPEAGSSYYTNSATRPGHRYEDYIVHDVVADVERRFPVADGSRRSIVGVSMGGYGAVKIAFKRPDLFVFAAGLSPALDVPSRPFSVKRIGQWRFHSSIFGPWQSSTRRENDPFILVRSADPGRTPYLFLTCGEQEGFLPFMRRFAGTLKERRFRYEFHTRPGGHDWNQWNAWLNDLFHTLDRQVR